MKAAIIAAGLGERLQKAGVVEPKPLVKIAGRPLIDHVLSAVTSAGIERVACIVNEIYEGIEAHCRETWTNLSFDFVRRTTPSSMESLFALAPYLDERFLLLTVDSIVSPAALGDFLRAAEKLPQADGVLAVNGFVDDEKPLWARLSDDGRLAALGAAAEGSGLVTAGFYIFEPTIFAAIEESRRRQFNALRQFLGYLIERGNSLYGAVVPKTVDVDRPEDIAVAEAFVRSGYRE